MHATLHATLHTRRQALLQLLEDLAWEEPEASAVNGAIDSAQPGVPCQVVHAPPSLLVPNGPPGVGGGARRASFLKVASQAEARVCAPDPDPHAALAALAGMLAAAVATPAVGAPVAPTLAACVALAARANRAPPLQPESGAGVLAWSKATCRDNGSAERAPLMEPAPESEPESPCASLGAALFAAFGEDGSGSACDLRLADYGSSRDMDGWVEGRALSDIPHSLPLPPPPSREAPFSRGSGGPGDQSGSPHALRTATPRHPPPVPRARACARWATAEEQLPSLMPEQRAAWLPGTIFPQLIEHHVAAALGAGLVSAPGAAGAAQRRPPPSCHRTVLSNLALSWLLRPGIDWPEGERRGTSGDAVASNASSGLELRVRGLDLQMDRYVPAPVGRGGSSYEGRAEGREEQGAAGLEWRLALVVRELEVLDRLHGKREEGDGGGGGGGGAAWPPLLELDRESLLPRDSGAFVAWHMEAVAAEVRLRLRLQPLRLHVDQRSLDFLLHFVLTALAPPAGVAASSTSPCAVGGAAGGGRGGAPGRPFFQMCDVRPLQLCIDYHPRRPSCREVYANPSRHHLANLLPLRKVRPATARHGAQCIDTGALTPLHSTPS